MRIGILGAGVMADALGTRWAAAGHEVVVAGRTEAKARALAEKWGARSGTFREAAEFGDVVLVAVLYQGIDHTLAEVGDALRGKPVIDCTNPVEVPVKVGDLRHTLHLEAMAAIVISLLFGGSDPHTLFNLVDSSGRGSAPPERTGPE